MGVFLPSRLLSTVFQVSIENLNKNCIRKELCNEPVDFAVAQLDPQALRGVLRPRPAGLARSEDAGFTCKRESEVQSTVSAVSLGTALGESQKQNYRQL